MAADGHAVMLACRVLAVSESGFYTQHHRAPPARAIRHAALTELIGRVHLDSRGTYGARRVHAELTLGHGLSVGRCAVELLMRRAGGRWSVRTSALPAHPQRGHGFRPGRTALLARRARPALGH
jgi:transposase InsO family protein